MPDLRQSPTIMPRTTAPYNSGFPNRYRVGVTQFGNRVGKNGRVVDDFMTTTTPKECFNEDTAPGVPI
jgi:hypothetical protein